MPALTRQPGGTRSCRLLPVALIACASFFQAFAHADDWGSFATVSNTSPGTLCDVTDDNRDLNCIAPNPQVLDGGIVSATGVSTTSISATYVQLSSPTTVLACGAGMAGAMRYTSGTMQVCNGAEWGNVGIGVPTGTISAFAASSCPNGWSEYTPARGRFLRGIDTLAAGIDPSGTRAPGSTQDDDLKSHRHEVFQFGAYGAGGAAQNTYNSNGTMRYTDYTGGDETRPKNVAVIFCQYAGFESQLAVGVATLASLSDVSVGAASNGQALVYDNGTWVPGAGGGSSDNLGDHTASQTLVMAGNDITGAGTVSGTSGIFSDFSGFGGVTSPQAAVDATGGSVSTTNIVLADGNAGSPALFFSNDADTGLYRNGTNRFAISAGGVLAAEFSNGGVSTTNISATYVQLSSPTTVLACGAGMAGAMRYTSGTMQVCNGAEWGNVGIGVPTGTISAFAASSCPNGWSEYTPSRGRFLRGIDNGAGNDPDGTRAPGDTQADALQNVTGSFNFGSGMRANSANGPFSLSLSTGDGAATGGNSGYRTVDFDLSAVARTANETRPKNVAVIFCQYAGYQSQLAVGVEGFSVEEVASGVYDAGSSDSPYSRVNADSFHTNGIGAGQMFIEGSAMDGNTTIYIGTGKAGGQAAQKVSMNSLNLAELCDETGSDCTDISVGFTPAGAVMAFDLASCPSGWSEYTPARGRFIRGIDNGAGNDPDGTRAPGHVQADELKSHTHAYGQTQAIGGGGGNLRNYATGSTFTTGATGGAETRPKNVALLYCRKD